MAYAELAVTTNFSFLRGASHPEELVMTAAELGISAVGIADRNSVAGVVRAHMAAKEAGLPLLVGARLVFQDGSPDVIGYPRDREGWARLCRLLSAGRLRGEKGECLLLADDLRQWREGLNLIVCPHFPFEEEDMLSFLQEMQEGGQIWLAASMTRCGDDNRRLQRLLALSRQSGIPLIATNDVLYHKPERRSLQDIVTCIREHVTLDQAGRRLEANAERHLKAPAEMARLFEAAPDAVAQTQAFLDHYSFSLDDLKYEYPDETPPGWNNPQEALEALVAEGVKRRYPDGLSEKVGKALKHELEVIGQLGYAPYFLTVHEIVRYARYERNILCQGRGSAANSAICYCLGITEINPDDTDLLFERFVSVERGEPPDIDIDFEHERREEVIQYIYRRYGRECAALTAVTTCYRARSAIREVGKVFGLSDDITGRLASTLWGSWRRPVTPERAERAGLQPSDPRLGMALHYAAELIGFPRHLSQHVGGFVISRRRLDESVPIENAAMEDRTVIEWNKDDLDNLGMLKVDVLGLGMLSCLRRSFDLLRLHYPGNDHDLSNLPREDEAIYRMLGRADAIGVFQVESRAQMSMLPRLKPRNLYDLVVEVAIVRPGPIQGNMVHPYLRRRLGEEEPDYGPNNQLYPVLQKTFGVPLFQEQAMRIAIVAAGFEPSRADKLRRAMATFRHVGTIDKLRDEFINGMLGNGYPAEFAQNCFRQIEGFGEYGFPESHAYSFALLVYASAWVKCHYPDVFATALVNSQPMGFYAPAQIIRDARNHGVPVRTVDINASCWDCTLEPASEETEPLHELHRDMRDDIRSTHAVRLGFRQVKGMSEDEADAISENRRDGYDSIRDLWLRTSLHPATLEKLAQADAFSSLGLSRRDVLWAVRALRRSGDKDDLPLFAPITMPEQEPDMLLPSMPPGKEVIEDYRYLHLSLKAHPLSFLRQELHRRNVTIADRLRHLPSGRRITVAGLVLVRQRPGSASGVIFLTLEDETGVSNIIIWPKIFEIYRPVVLGARLVSVTGTLQNANGVIHIVADKITDLSSLVDLLGDGDNGSDSSMPKGRNFH